MYMYINRVFGTEKSVLIFKVVSSRSALIREVPLYFGPRPGLGHL